MNLRRALFALSALPCLSFGQSSAPLPEATLARIEKRLSPLAQKYQSVAFVLARVETKSGWAELNFKPVSTANERLAEQYADLLTEEFSKYPTDFMASCGLKMVELVEGLAIGSQFRTAVPDYEHEVLYYDVTAVQNVHYARHVAHHEFFHMLEERWNETGYYKDPNWAFLNDEEFKYGAGGADAYGRGDVWTFVHPAPGFVNVYSIYGLEEDKAEVWAAMFVPDNWAVIKEFLADDPILRAKVAYLREFARSKSRAIDDAFWTSVSGEGATLQYSIRSLT